ncbi:hypothetical protein FRC06_011898 [Ceratobasidium sp. 370]|nr:hypothetical protein FRC06_011898 [Ceratobasidium sp. 370]
MSRIDATLSLEVYDFLRVCPQHIDQVIPNDDLHLGLNSLREDILATLLFMREGMPVPAQAGPSKKRAAEAGSCNDDVGETSWAGARREQDQAQMLGGGPE